LKLGNGKKVLQSLIIIIIVPFRAKPNGRLGGSKALKVHATY